MAGLSSSSEVLRGCTGPDRAGAPPAFPSLVDVLSRLSVKQVTDTIKKGVGRMPSFPNIDCAKINALVDYLRTSYPSAKSDAAKELRITVRSVTAITWKALRLRFRC